VDGRGHAYDVVAAAWAPVSVQTGAGSTAVTPGNRRARVVFSLLGVVGIALILFVVVAATAGVVFGK
jgi:hypothetical protein